MIILSLYGLLCSIIISREIKIFFVSWRIFGMCTHVFRRFKQQHTAVWLMTSLVYCHEHYYWESTRLLLVRCWDGIPSGNRTWILNTKHYKASINHHNHSILIILPTSIHSRASLFGFVCIFAILTSEFTDECSNNVASRYKWIEMAYWAKTTV